MYKLIRDNIPELAKQNRTPIKYAAVDDKDFLFELLLNILFE